LEATRGRSFSFVNRHSLLRGWGSRAPGRRWACSGLDHMWPEGTQYQCPDEAPGGAEGTVATEQRFCFVLLLLVICEKYIHKKIEANLLKSVAYIGPNARYSLPVPLYNSFVPIIIFSRFVISVTPFRVNGTEMVKSKHHSSETDGRVNFQIGGNYRCLKHNDATDILGHQ